MTWYSARKYQSSVFAEVSIKESKKNDKNKNALQEKLRSGLELDNGLDQDDISSLVEEV